MKWLVSLEFNPFRLYFNANALVISREIYSYQVWQNEEKIDLCLFFFQITIQRGQL